MKCDIDHQRVSSRSGTIQSRSIQSGFHRDRPASATDRVWWGALCCAALAVSSSLGCGPDAVVKNPRPSLLDGVQLDPDYPTPAVWRYHPPSASPLQAQVALDDLRTLYVGEGGERWLFDASSESVRAASDLAPETLVAGGPTADGEYRFIGRSGAGYVAPAPLAPFSRVLPPTRGFAQVAANAETVLGVGRDFLLYATHDGGASWAQVGPEDVAFQDVAVIDEEHALALAVPEAIWQSRDQGRTWKQAELAPRGVIGFHQSASGSLVASVFGPQNVRFTEERLELVPLQGRVKRSPRELPQPPSVSFDAVALTDHQAAIVGADYWRLERGKKDKGWRVRSLSVADALGGTTGANRATLTDIPFSDECRKVSVAGFERWLYVACLTSASRGNVLFLRSADRGRTFSRDSLTATGDFKALRFAVGDGGALVVTGVCPKGADGPGCAPTGLYYRRPSTDSEEPDSFELGPAAAPSLTAVASAVAFDSSGKHVYGVARRTKNDALTVYISTDAGRSYTPHELSQVKLDGSGQVPSVESLAVANDGHVSVVLERYESKNRIIVTDAEGRLVAANDPPVDSALVAAHGLKAVALSVDSKQVWESLDGGATWEALGEAPAALCSDAQCDEAVFCHSAGCVFGSRFSRFGWGGQETSRTASFVPESARPPTDADEEELGTPLACQFAADKWLPLPPMDQYPTASSAAIGQVDWFVPSVDDATGAVNLLEAHGGNKPQVLTTPILPPVADPENFASIVSLQVEGIAALRYRIPEAAGRPLTSVQVGWKNLFAGQTGRATFSPGTRWTLGDAEHAKRLGRLAKVDLLTIGATGIYVRPVASLDTRQDTFFLDGRRVVQLPNFDTSRLPKGHFEMLADGAAHHHLFISEGGAVVAQVRYGVNGLEYSAQTVGLVDPRRFLAQGYYNIGYKGSAPILYQVIKYSGARAPSARVFAFQGEGTVVSAPELAPTQADVADVPRRCTSLQISQTARVVAPEGVGPRRPVVVSDPVEPARVMLSGSAVMHGSPDAPCMRALDAHTVQPDSDLDIGNEHSIISLDDLEHSWLFRVDPKSPPGKPKVEYRTIACRFDPSMPIPPDILSKRKAAVP